MTRGLWARLDPALAAQLARLLRFPAFAAVAAVLVVPLLHAAILRYPALGLVMGLLEVILRAVRPVAATQAVRLSPGVDPPAAAGSP